MENLPPDLFDFYEDEETRIELANDQILKDKRRTLTD